MSKQQEYRDGGERLRAIYPTYNDYIRDNYPAYKEKPEPGVVYSHEGVSKGIISGFEKIEGNNNIFIYEKLENGAFCKLRFFSSKDDAIEQIPKNIHYVWLAKPNLQKALPDTFIKKTFLHNLELMPESEGWQHMLWTNVPELVQAQFEDINFNSLQIKALSEYKESLLSFDHINLAISTSSLIPRHMGLAVDLLKYSVAYAHGGIVADLNFDFKITPPTGVLANNFLADPRFENSFFGAIAGSAIIKTVIDLYNSDIEKSDNRDLETDRLWEEDYVQPLSTLFKKFHDVEESNYDTQNLECAALEYNAYCAEFVIGHDNKELSWH